MRRATGIALTVLLAAVGLIWLLASPERGATRTEPINGEAVSAGSVVVDEAKYPNPRRALPDPEASPSLTGRVLSSERVPLVGAVVSWIALQPEDKESVPAWPSPGWGVPDRRLVRTTTDADGTFRFEREPESPSGTVLTALLPGYLAGGHDLPAGNDSWARGIEIVLEASPVVEVLVVDSSGKARGGATVHHVGTTNDQGPLFRRFLQQSVETDAEGRALLGSLPGEQALWAEKGDLVSHPWQGARPSKVTLTLGESFTVGGTISFPDLTWQHAREGERRILVSAQIGRLWKPFVTLRDVSDGVWGPLPIPLEGVSQYRIRFEGAPIQPIEETFPPPKPSTHRRFDFIGKSAHALVLRVESEEGSLVPQAKAIAWWSETVHPVGGQHAEGAVGSDGHLHLEGLPAGWVRYRVWAPGYQVFETQDESTRPDKVLVTLRAAGRVTGRCVHRGEPVPDFEVIFWKEGNPRVHLRQSFFGRPDGSFELDSLAPGDWSFHASSESLPCGKPTVARVEAGKEAHVEIEIPAAIRGVGQVIDAESGEPVAEARIQLYSSGGLQRSYPWGSSIAVSQDGTFEVDAFVLGTNYMTVAADGYAEAEVQAVAVDEDFLEWGEIRLHKPQSLEIRLLGWEELPGILPTELHASTAEGFLLPKQHFSPEGVVLYPSIPPGDHQVLVTYPDTTWARLQLSLDPDKEWRFDFKVGGARIVHVRVLGADGDPAASRLLLVSCQEETGVYVVRLGATSEEGIATFRGIRAEKIQVWLLDDQGSIVTSQDHAFGDLPEMQVDIRIDETPLRVRVIDSSQLALVGGWVTARSRTGEEVLGIDDTDSQGWATLSGVPSESVLLDVHHGIAGRRQGIAIDGAVREHEIVLEAEGSLVIRVVDGDEPLATVSARIETAGGVTLSEALQSDAQGIVRFEPLGEGTLRIGFRRADCWPAVLERALAADEKAEVDAQMRRLADLELTVLDPNGVLVSGVEVALSSLEFGADVASWVREERVRAPQGLTTDVRGVLRIEGLPRGAYSWSVSGADQAFSGSFELAPTKTNLVQLRLAN